MINILFIYIIIVYLELARCSDLFYNIIDGAWRSLVAHLVWDQGVVSSNLTVPRDDEMMR